MSTFDEASAARDQLEQSPPDVPGLTMIGVGVVDEQAGSWGVVVGVTDPSSVSGLPASVGDVPLVVVQADPPVVEDDLVFYSPVQGGISIANQRQSGTDPATGLPLRSAGTLGAVVRDLQSGKPLGLSCFHVLCPSGYAIGDTILQPEIGGRLGQLTRAAFPETTPAGTIDAAVCSIERPASASIVDLGSVISSGLPLPGPVTKRGKSTARPTTGDLRYFDVTLFNADYGAYGKKTITGALGIVSTTADGPLSAQGDSGAVFVDSRQQAVGLHFAGTAGGTMAYAIPINVVETQLGVSCTWPAPFIQSVSPSQGPAAGGTQVTLSGSGLGSATLVTFNGNPGTQLTAIDDTSLSVVTPAGSGVVFPTVTAIGGTAAATDSGSFSYQ